MYNSKEKWFSFFKTLKTPLITVLAIIVAELIHKHFNFNMTLIVAIIALIMNAVFEFIFVKVSLWFTKITVLFGKKNQFFENEFNVSQDNLNDGILKLAIQITIHGDMKNVEDREISIEFPGPTLFTLEKDDQTSNEQLQFDIDEATNIMKVMMPRGGQTGADFSFYIRVKLTQSSPLIQCKNAIAVKEIKKIVAYKKDHFFPRVGGIIKHWLVFQLQNNKFNANIISQED